MKNIKAFFLSDISNMRMVYFFLFIFAFIAQCLVVYNGLHEDLLTVLTESIRIQNGQTVYQDYTSHNSPITGILLSFFIDLFSIGFGYILLSALGNALITVIMAKVVYRITSSIRLSLMSGLLISVWFFVQVGGWYYDHVAYFFALMSAALFVFFEVKNKYILFIIGVLLGISFWSKPTVGVVSGFALVLPILFIYLKYWKKILIIIYGGLASIIFGVLLIYTYSDILSFFQSFVFNSLEYADHSDNKKIFFILESFLIPYHMNLLDIFYGRHFGALIFYLTIVILIYVTYLVFFFKREFIYKNKSLLIFCYFIVLSSIMSSSIVGRNFMQAVFGLPAMVSLIFYILANGRIKSIRFKYVYIVTAILFLVALAYVYKNFNDSKGHFINYTNEYEYYPIKLNQTYLPFADIKNLVEVADYLKNKSGKIAMYDDNARILAALLNRPSWNTGLTQMYNITIPIDKEKRIVWQEKEIEHLQKNKVEWVVSTLNSSKRAFRIQHQSPPGFLDIEVLSKYIKNKFLLTKVMGSIEIYKRK